MPAPTRPPPPPPPPAQAAPVAPKTAATSRRLTVATAKAPCPRLLIYAVEGWGKTSIGAFAPDPVVLMARGESGYSTLLSAGLVPAVPAVTVETWDDLLQWLDTLIADQQGRKTIVLDALGGFERLCHEKVCARDFGNDWGEKGFASFQKGYDMSVSEWLKLLQRLDKLNDAGVIIVMLGHARIRSFKNPIGADYDRFEADVHAKTWAATARWADTVLFGNFQTIVDKVKQGKGKGVGGTDRKLYTERRDAWDAKNRYGMPEEIAIENDRTKGWETVWSHIVPAK